MFVRSRVGEMALKISAVVGSILFLVIAPGFIAGLVPFWISHWRLERGSGISAPLFITGWILIAIAAGILLDSFARFALRGLGTPAPVFPTRRLVVTGFYRWVRNPMYLGVVSAILGQALIFENLALLAYAALVWLLCHIFVIAYEEPALKAGYGPDYQSYCAAVPRWIPRLTPWSGDFDPAANGT